MSRYNRQCNQKGLLSARSLRLTTAADTALKVNFLTTQNYALHDVDTVVMKVRLDELGLKFVQT